MSSGYDEQLTRIHSSAGEDGIEYVYLETVLHDRIYRISIEAEAPQKDGLVVLNIEVSKVQGDEPAKYIGAEVFLDRPELEPKHFRTHLDCPDCGRKILAKLEDGFSMTLFCQKHGCNPDLVLPPDFVEGLVEGRSNWRETEAVQ